MKTQLIILEQGNIIVSDEKCKIKDWCYNTYNKIYQLFSEHEVKSANDYIESKDVFKLIASDNPEHNLPTIDYSALSDEDCKKIGYIDVEKLANKYYGDDDYAKESKIGFIKGFKKAQSLNDKKFSLEDMLHLAKNLSRELFLKPGFGIEDSINITQEIIKELQRHKVFDVEIKNDKKFSLDEVQNIAINFAEHCKSMELLGHQIYDYNKFFIDSSDEIGIKSIQPKVFDVEIKMERTRYPKDDDGWEDIYNPKITNNSIKITKVL